MATRTAMGVRARRLAPTRWELEVPPERVVSGDRVRSSASVAGSGGRIEAEWVVVGEAGGEVRLRLVSPEAGEREVVVRLEETVSPAGEKREER
jgi:hypothetical protein